MCVPSVDTLSRVVKDSFAMNLVCSHVPGIKISVTQNRGACYAHFFCQLLRGLQKRVRLRFAKKESGRSWGLQEL